MAEQSGEETSALDRLALDLQELRHAAGAPSYADLVQRIGRLRVARGVPEVEARPARTTVYDAFRTGRRRLDVGLLEDVVRVLGVPEQEVADWSRRCREAQAARPPVAAPDPGQAPRPSPRPAPVPDPVPEPPRGLARRALAIVLLGSLLLNLAGRTVVDLLDLPLHLDMVGTAIAAVVVGPWWGALVGLATNVAGSAVSGPESIPFALVNVVGALLWGHGVRRLGLGRSIPRFFALSVGVALACSLTAAPIVLWLYGGASDNAGDRVVATLLALGTSLVVSVFSSNLLTSMVDKVISGFVALVAAEALLGPGWGDRLAGARRTAGEP